jgi:hypothetical protein
MTTLTIAVKLFNHFGERNISNFEAIKNTLTFTVNRHTFVVRILEDDKKGKHIEVLQRMYNQTLHNTEKAQYVRDLL